MQNVSPHILSNVNLIYIESEICSIHEEFEMWLYRLKNKQKYFSRFEKVLKICYGLLYQETMVNMKKNENLEVF